jgi:GDPmannose 4,6-dehydratase
MPKALVLGINGQDGSYAAEALLRRGYLVVGAGKQEKSRYLKSSPSFSYRQLDLQDAGALDALLKAERPDVAMHLAAVHGAAGFRYEPVFASMMAVNVVAAQTVLEYARREQPGLKFVYANSAKVMPTPLSGTIDESTPRRASCLYSVGKTAASDIIDLYRESHGIFAANLILFNHESVRRAPEYFLPKLAAGLARSMREPGFRFSVKTLDFRMDWSCAEEFMDIAADIAERAPPGDYVLASGVTRHARESVDAWFRSYNLDYRQHVDESLPPQSAGPEFRVDVSKLYAAIGRRPERSIDEVVSELVNLNAH